ncbi:MAG: M28 family peptidase, partial [Candidatus Coatesbacteria bacterium]
MKWLSVILFSLAQAAFAGDVFVLVEYEEREQAYELLDDGWAVVEAHPSFCLIFCSEEQAGAVPGGSIIADGFETLYVIWNPGKRQLPDIKGTRIIDVPGKVQILVARAGDAMEYAAAGAELKLVNETPVRKPVDAPPLRTYDDKVPFADRYILEMIDKITPERYQEIVETLSVGITPSRYTPSTYFEAATDYVQTTFHEIPNMDVQVWHYEGDIRARETYWSGKYNGWISTRGYVWRTDDGGETWNAYKCNGNVLDVMFTDVNNGFLCGYSGYIARTLDGGITWSEADIQDNESVLSTLSFADRFNGIAGGFSGIYYVTDDGGDTWEKGRIPSDYRIRSVFYLDDIIWAAASKAFVSECLLYRSADGGETWENLSGNLPSFPDGALSKIWFHDTNGGVVIGRDNIHYTEDGGNTWAEAAGEYGGSLRDIFFINNETGWIGGAYGFIYRTDDGGKSWTTQIAGSERIESVFFVSADEGWAINDDADIYNTDDGGYTWDIAYPEFIYPTWENVIAEIEGTVNPDEVIIICGHYDSFSIDAYRLAPGAEDNASGSGGVIAAAEAMADYEYESTVRFIAFSGEENGLIGSDAYAEAMAEKGENIVAVINMDMVAYLDEPVYDIKLGYNGFTELRDAVIAVGVVYTPELEIYPEHFGISDDTRFADYGFPAVGLIEQYNEHFYPWIHRTEDLPEHLDFTYGAEVVRLAAATAATLAGIIGPRPDDGETDLIVYPNPARPGDAGITFANLPDNASLALYNVAGERVFGRVDITANETVWTLVNASGNPIASGVYIYRVTDVDGNHAIGKVAV